MKIRWKLLILLLVIALGPLIAAGVLQRASMRRLGRRLASGTREILTLSARRHLQALVDNYGRIVARDKKALELAVRVQAGGVEHCLAATPPAAPRLFFSADYDKGTSLPKGMHTSKKHFRLGPDDNPTAVPVTYEEQVFFVVKGVDRKTVADDMGRLSTMPKVYKLLHEANPDVMHWQYTSLESGFHSSYPGHGGYPDDYDPRVRKWYTDAKESGGLSWVIMPDVSTRNVTLGVSMPVHRPDGSFAGVTAIDVPLKGVLKELTLPEDWAEEAETMLVYPGEPGSDIDRRLGIVAHESYEGHVHDWRAPVEVQFVDSDDKEEFGAMLRGAAAGRSGVRKMRYKGAEALWAYGTCGPGQPFPLVIVPYDRIVARAAEAEQYVLDKTVAVLRNTGIILAGVVVIVAIVAFVSSRSVTRPVARLADAAARLAGGDFDAKVDIRTGDELQELGRIFNETGPMLRERERMKRSLALAMEIQQHLLPQENPSVENFDVAGRSVYCDETGGDYYDFIDLVDLGPGKIGIALGDVTGHGIAAALLMASARGVLRSHAGRHGGDLAKLFEALNTHLVRDTGEDKFITLFYGVLDGPSRSLAWTSGGHDPGLWLHHATGEFEELPNTGVPLGIVEGAAYEQGGPVVLEPGDLILVGTDGIWEARNLEGQMFGKQRLRDLMAASAGMPADEIHQAVVDAVASFRGAAPQTDDITLVVIKAL